MFASQTFVLFIVLACLLQHAHGSEIINGTKVPKNLMRFMVSVQTDDGIHVCGGFLISQDFVLTAAHCDRSKPTYVVLGTHNLKKVKMRYSVTRCRHPDFKAARSGDDIMLLKLSKKVRPDQKVQTVQLPKAGMDVKDNTKCYVAGWGYEKDNGGNVDQLEMVDVDVVNLKRCQAVWRHRNLELPPNVICAGGYQTTNGFCKGDSGGPLVCDGVAVGVVSFNMNCHYPNAPNIYTDVSKYLHWIKTVQKQNSC